MKVLIAGLLMIASVVARGGVAWRNLDEAHQLGGRKTSEGYVQGKVVLVCREAESYARLEPVWQSFKMKEFVLIGTVPAVGDACTFPQYRDAGLVTGEPEDPLYVVGGDGRVVYHGRDDRTATQAAVSAITDLAQPRNAAQWRSFLSFELETLPGHAYLRYLDLRKAQPTVAAEFDEQVRALGKVPDVKDLAAFVSFAQKAKDRRPFDPKKQAVQRRKFAETVKATAKKYVYLRESADPRVAQEAKNAFADLMWSAVQ